MLTKQFIYDKLCENKDDFNRLEDYRKRLLKAKRIVIDFTNTQKIWNFIEDTKNHIEKSTSEIDLPYDNIIFNIKGVAVPNPEDGKPTPQELFLHVSPVTIGSDIASFVMMLIQDIRIFKEKLYYQSHMIGLADAPKAYGAAHYLQIMPSVDMGTHTEGCHCYSRNLLTVSALSKEVKSKTPDYKHDLGYAIPQCDNDIPVCRGLKTLARTITGITIAAMEYITMPCINLLRVQSPEEEAYLVALDDEQILDMKEKDVYKSSRLVDVFDHRGMKGLESKIDKKDFKFEEASYCFLT